VGLPFHLASLSCEDPLAAPRSTWALIDPSINVNASNGVDGQVLQAQVPYPGDAGLAYDFGNNGPESWSTLYFPEHVPNIIGGPSGPSGNVGGFDDVLVPMVGINPPDAWANPLLYQDSIDVPGGWMNIGDIPACDKINIHISSLQLRGVRSPPQAYEGDAKRLYNRLISEGADFDAAMVLRDVIFAEGVTRKALMAPIPTREMFIAYSGARRMWQLLLETRGVVPGKQKYRCRLCPVGNRPEYKYDRDAVRHFNKDHFGFSFLCERW